MLQIHTSSSRAAWVRTLTPRCGWWAAPGAAVKSGPSTPSQQLKHMHHAIQDVQHTLRSSCRKSSVSLLAVCSTQQKAPQSVAPSTAQRRLSAPGGDTRTLRGTVSVPSTSNRASTRFPDILAAVGAETSGGETVGASELYRNADVSDQSNVVVLTRFALPSLFLCDDTCCN